MKTIYVVPHTHYDAAWLKTYEEYLAVNFSNLYEMLEVLARDPDFRFTLDQTALVEPFLQRHPQHAALFRRMVEEGRLELVCGMYVMPDANMPCGESLIRQILEGKRFFREALGVDTKVGWMLDVFGHNPQMPQIMRKAGYDYYVFGRGIQKGSISEFTWRGLDGSQIIAHWMPYHYVIFYPTPKDPEEFEAFVETRLQMMKPHCRLDYCLMLNGADFVPPDGHLPEMARRYNAKQDKVKVLVATPSDFLSLLKEEKLPVIEGEFNPVFQGCYSSRIPVKQGNRKCEALLLTAESLGAVAAACHPATPDIHEELQPAWKRVLFEQFHDVICGCHSDRVFAEAMEDYRQAEKDAVRAVESRLAFCDQGAALKGEALQTLWVFNPLAWVRTEVAEVRVSLVAGGIRQVRVETEAGQEVPCQLSEVQYHPDKGLKEFTLAFLAEVPGLGYRRYRLLAGKAEGAEKTDLTWSGDTWQDIHQAKLANEWLSLTFNEWTGAMESVRFLEAGWELIDQANPLGNVIVRETDRGDLWDYNAPCKGTALAPTARPMPFPKAWEADFSTQYGGIGETGGGPVFAEFHLSGSFGEGSRRVRVRVYAHTPRIDFKTTLVNRQKWVRYRAAFPTSLRDGRIVHEVPFGAIERPEGEYPAQNWIDCCDGEKGLGLLNRGLPGNNVTAGVMMLSLLKSSTIPGQPCDGAFELGNEHQFDYALYPHGGDWQDAALPRRGLEYNFPLVVRAAGTAGRGPASFSLLRAEPENILVTSAASEGGRLQVRLYEAHGKRVPASLWLGKRIASVRETNLLGQPYRRKVFSEGEQIKFHIGPFEIRQFQIETD